MLTVSISDTHYLSPIYSRFLFKDILSSLNQSLLKNVGWREGGRTLRKRESERDEGVIREWSTGKWSRLSCWVLLWGYRVTGSVVYGCTMLLSKPMWEYLEIMTLFFSLRAKLDCPGWSGRHNASEALEYVSVNPDPVRNLTPTIAESLPCLSKYKWTCMHTAKPNSCSCTGRPMSQILNVMLTLTQWFSSWWDIQRAAYHSWGHFHSLEDTGSGISLVPQTHTSHHSDTAGNHKDLSKEHYSL